MTTTGQDRVGLVRGGALGDFVLTLPAADALRVAVPGAALVAVGNPARAALARPADVVDADGAPWGRLFVPGGAPSPALRQRFAGCRLLLAYVPDGPGAAALHRALEDLAERVILADPRPSGDGRRHAVDHLLEPLRTRGLPNGGPARPHIGNLGLEGHGAAGDISEDTVVVHPGSGAPGKCWPAERFGALVGWLREHRLPVCVLWGPAEAERAAQLLPHLPPQVTLLSPATPVELARRLSRARLYVGNDSGPGHVAAAVGTPTLSLFGPTDPAVWRPLGPRARFVRAREGSLANLCVEEVIAAVEVSLEEGRG